MRLREGCTIADMTAADVQQKIGLAMQLVGANRAAEAEGVLREVLSEDPVNDRAMSAMARVAYATGRGEAAVELLRAAAALNPGVLEHQANLGTVLSSLGRLDEAIAVFRGLVGARPDL